MNAPAQLRLPLAPVNAPRRWYAIVRPGADGRWITVALAATDLDATAGIPNTLARLYGNGATALYMGARDTPPTEQQIDRAANPERLPAAPISADIDAMDNHKHGTRTAPYPLSGDYAPRWTGTGIVREFIK
jgi:hypothetical protein